MITVQFTGRNAKPNPVHIGVEGDHLAESIEFGLPTITAGQTVYLHVISKSGQADIITLVDNTLDVTSPLTVSGNLTAFIRIAGANGELWHSNPIYLRVSDLPGVDESIEQIYPTAVQQMLTEMQKHDVAMDEQETSIDGKVTAAQTAQTGAEAAQGIAEQKAILASDKATEAAGSAGMANADREIVEGVKGEVLAVLESEEDREIAEEDRNTSEIERKAAEVLRELAKAQTLADLEGEYAPALSAVVGQLAAIATEFDEVIANATVDSEVINARNSDVKGKTFTNLDNRLEEIEMDDYFPATNLVTNGDFSNGTTGWNTVLGTISIDAGACKFVASDVANARIYKIIGTIIGNKYYVRADVKRSNGNSVSLSVGDTPAIFNSLVANSYNKLSAVVIPVATTSYSINFFNTTVGEEIYIDNEFALNLTVIFGAGNEPTAAQMDRLLARFPNSWFDGTANLFNAKAAVNEMKRLDDAKANVAQEAWITPTLVNGWVEDGARVCRYKKDNCGTIHIKGWVSGGTVGQNIFTLPAGYRPLANRGFAVWAEVGYGRVFIASNGSVTAFAPTTTTGLYIDLMFTP